MLPLTKEPILIFKTFCWRSSDEDKYQEEKIPCELINGTFKQGIKKIPPELILQEED